MHRTGSGSTAPDQGVRALSGRFRSIGERAWRARRSRAAIGLLAVVIGCPRPTPAPPVPAPPVTVTEAPEPAIPPPPCEWIARIEVHKDEHALRAYCERGAVVTFRVALGREPHGPKSEAGDFRTPEGEYRVVGAARPSRFRLFIPIDYPSREQAEMALAEGRLSEADYARILDAHRLGQAPPSDTPLGGGLGFHGEGERWRGESDQLDWTTGCIAMADSAIEFLAERVQPGTPVWILP